MKPCCKKVIVVEGKYDKIRLDSLLSATVITTEGFGLFRDQEKSAMLRRIAEEKGLVVLCDSDGGGKVIRSRITTLTGGKGVTHLYIPPIKGKEKRKSVPGKEGLLGVEGMDNETLLALFEKSGLLENKEIAPRYTRGDLYRLGYFGAADSRQKRGEILRQNRLPESLSTTAFLDIINLLEISL